MSRAKQLMKNWRIIFLAILLVLAVIAINPKPDAEGVAIRSVITNSSANIAGIENPKPAAAPMSREVIIAINNKPIKTVMDYDTVVSALQPKIIFTLKTNKQTYRLTSKPIIKVTVLNETEEKIVGEIVWKNVTLDNGTVQLVNETINKTIIVNKTKEEIIGTEDIGLTVYAAPTSNLRKGLDLQGGTRVLLQPEEYVSVEDMDILIENMKYRLNVYGLSDVVIREAGDLSGNQYVLVEIAGANKEEVRQLLAQQGKFEAKVGDIPVFRGGSDVVYVARSSTQAGIDPQQGCGKTGDGSAWACRFRFAITLDPDAAQRQADATKDLDVIIENSQDYLSEKLYLYLDDELVDELNIGADLKGRATTDIAISGSGGGLSREEAVFDALKNMKRLQTILITGSLPVKLRVVKTDSISPVLGEEFTKNVMLIAILAVLVVSVVVFIRYRKWQISVPMFISMISEVVLLFGLASLIGWNLDLAAIAGIIIAVGTGVDHLIIISDETLRKGAAASQMSLKEKIKKAFFIIMGAYFTSLVAMLPLWFAGAGLLKGFAITTIFGISFGVFVTRPAFAAAVEILLKD